jgi:hypothetical protein
VDFVVCTLAVKKKKLRQVSICRIGPFPCELAQSVYRLATGWATDGSEFEFREGKKFSLHLPDWLRGPHGGETKINSNYYHNPASQCSLK